MAKFGLVTEGITDQIVIENILCGFYKDYEDLDEEIFALEPPRDETDMRQAYSEFGTGWSAIFNYLGETRFRDDVLNSEYIIIQIDTDIAEEIKCSKTQSIEEIIECVIQRMVDKIDTQDSFYEEHKQKILFAISVHSLECWLLPIFGTSKREKILNCEDKLKIEVPKVSKKLKTEKNYRNYDKLSQDFLKYKKLMKIVSKNSSFKIFIKKLPIEL
ncbi:phage tail protein [Sulfurovum sp. bin170]|uniref:phage tail protein n=1 Tax=Sulfurovum sp. bin170 TaxID=2695268 RepID=UPI0013DF527E|nr:phage tail protein [Sulfurovum sp. bin170]NEW60647.1 phage tail protein [Sulfurovum sp. bin170]